jgi:glycosyltransferase involved in cell wall biosynthesis
MRRLKIGYISRKDPRNIRSWSGTPYFIVKSLDNHVGDVTYLGEIRTPLHSLGKIINSMLYPLNLRYNYAHSIPLARTYAKKIKILVHHKPFDIIFTHGSTEIALMETDIPIILTSDATFSALEQYYNYFSNILKFSSQQSKQIEKLAFDKAALLLFASNWAARHAHEDYNINESKINIIQYGANLDQTPGKTMFLNRKTNLNKCKLLFIGVDWFRKGGDIAFETMIELNKIGIHTELIVCGTMPPKSIKHNNLTVIPFLHKNNADDKQKLLELYSNADYFILPTRSECAGVVFCESSAFGLPILATNTGGVSSYVQDNINGYLLPLEAKGKDYADIIYRIHTNQEAYNSLSQSSRKLFEDKLNWDVWGINVRKLISEKLGI